jgi:hypothetical protein
VSGTQITAVAAAFVILLAITLAAHFRKAHRYLVFASGVAVVLSLRIANLPPWWFDGGGSAFALAGSLLLGGFVNSRPGEARNFGRPLLYAMGLTMVVVNGVAFVMARI